MERIISIQVKAAPPALVQVQGPPFEHRVGQAGGMVLILTSMDARGRRDNPRADYALVKT